MNESFDVIVVGAGVAGALSAFKLAQAGRHVLLLEAADHATTEDQRKEFKEWMVPNTNRGDMHAPYSRLASRRYAPSPEAAGKPEEKYFDGVGPDQFKAQYVRLVGGSTWAWRGNTPRFVPNDFRLKTVYGVGEDWAITYADLEPWYVMAEHELGVAGNHAQWDGLHGGQRSQPFPMEAIPLSYGDVLVKQQFDAKVIDGMTVTVRSTPQARNSRAYDDRPACHGNSNCIPLCPIGAKYDAGVHVRKALQTGRVELRTGSVVTRLETDATGRVTTVHYKNWRSADKLEEHVVNANVVILAANAIETAKLLLLSNLATRSGQVGRNLMDHLQDEVTTFFPEPLYPFRGPQSTCSIEDFRDGSFRHNHSAIRMTVGNDGHGRAKAPMDVLDDYLEKDKLFGKDLLTKLEDRVPRMLRIGFSTEMLPNPNNRVSLSTKLDEYGLPRPQIRFEVEQYTYNALKKGHEIAVTLMDSIQGINKAETKERDWQRKYSTAAHIMGTCRMGNDPSKSVVDSNGRTHEHANLYIVGASVFTTSGTANPTLTAAALALKTADAIIHSP